MRTPALRIVFSLLPLFMLTLALPAVQPAWAATRSIEAQLQKQKKKIERIEAGIKGHQQKLHRSEDEEQDLLSDLDTIETNLQEQRSKLGGLQTDLDHHEDTIHSLQEEMGKVNSAKEALKGHLQTRLSSFYRMGSIGYMNVIFSTSSLPDLLNFQEYFRLMLHNDHEIISQFRDKIADLTKRRANLQQEKSQLLGVIVEIKDQEQNLAETRQKRAALLGRVRTEKKLYQRALQEMEEAAGKLSTTMTQLKKAGETEKLVKARPRPDATKKTKAAPPATGNILARKGRLSPPVTGTVTALFGRQTQKQFGLTSYGNGIDIKPEPNAKILAIFDGRVVFADKLRGYGKTMIIDHGQQYYSLVSRASKLLKNKGDLVKEGEIIGSIDESSGLLGEGLHFEIRHGTDAENPLKWVNNGMLRLRTNQAR
jgi:septal ring factor EnvC (AmiA/AmiB activator)